MNRAASRGCHETPPQENPTSGLMTPDLVRISPELAIACYRAGYLDAFILWVELQCLSQKLAGDRYRSGHLPYLDAKDWLCARRWDERRVEDLIREDAEIFFEVLWRWPKPPMLLLKGFMWVCKYFEVIPWSSWRQVPLDEFTNARRSIVRAVMAYLDEEQIPGLGICLVPGPRYEPIPASQSAHNSAI